MGFYAAVRREPERGVGAVLRPCPASSTGSRRGSDVLVTILDPPGAGGYQDRRQRAAIVRLVGTFFLHSCVPLVAATSQ